jgi:hypothetical protein
MRYLDHVEIPEDADLREQEAFVDLDLGRIDT